MRKKFLFAWSLVAAMVMTGCSSDQSEDLNVSGKTGTMTLNIDYGVDKGTTRVSTARPATSWSNVNKLQFFLYRTSDASIVWSAIEKPGTVTGVITYPYTTIPEGTYKLVALANAQSDDAVSTYASNSTMTFTVPNVVNRLASTLDIRHKAGSFGTMAAVSGHNPFTQPSEVFMGYADVTIASGTTPTVNVSLTREVSLMRVRIDQTEDVVKNSIEFDKSAAGVMLYNLPTKMGIQQGNAGGIGAASVATDILSVQSAYSKTASDPTGSFLEAPYTAWKDVVVFPNNGGRANTNKDAVATNKYFIVICGVAKAGHVYSETDDNGDAIIASAGDLVYWYGEIDKVFSPNTIREVNVALKTGGMLKPPPGIVKYGNLEIKVSSPEPWGAIVTAGPIEM